MYTFDFTGNPIAYYYLQQVLLNTNKNIIQYLKSD